MIKAVKQSAMMNPTFHSYWLSVAAKLSFPFYELGIVGENYENEKEKIDRMFLPNVILFGGKGENNLEILRDRYAAGKTLFYVCENRVCQLPVEDSNKAIEQILK